jgi:branched-chain amino acid aminotransferase
VISPPAPHGGWAGTVWLNGELVPAADAKISVFDRGILLGDGVYETLRVHHRRIFRWSEHRSRLERSLSAAGIVLPYPTAALEEAIGACVGANHLPDARVRITMTRGEGDPGFDLMPGTLPNTIIAASPWRPVPRERYDAGVAAITATIRQTGSDSLDPALKSISRIHLVLARMEATRLGAQEAILLGSDGMAREGTASNLFIVKDGRLVTPAVESGILEGVTRAIVLEQARRSGMAWAEGAISQADLQSAEEIFLTNTSWGALPVGLLDAKPVGLGKAGMVAREMGRRITELVERECVP